MIEDRDEGGPMRFCVFLYEQGLLSDKDCMLVLRTRCARTPSLGKLGIRKRLLTVPQLRQLLALQAERSEALGQLALAEGMLDVTQLQALLDQQRQETPLARALVVELGLLAPEAVERAHRQFLAAVF